MFRGDLELHATIRAPITAAFEALTDHEGMAAWPGVASALLVREGSPRNGPGAVRRIRAGGLTIDEELVAWSPPHRFEYRIVKGLPVRHRGEVELNERTEDGGPVTTVTWRIRMSSPIPFFAPIVGWRVKDGLREALASVTRRLEASYTALP